MRAILLVACLAAPAVAEADGLSGPETAALVAAAMRDAGIAGAPPAPLRSLPPCRHAPHVEPLNGSWTTAELRCEDPVWKRALRTKAHATAPARAAGAPRPEAGEVTLARPVARGSALAAEDLAPGDGSAEQKRWQQALIGRRLKVALAPGQPILPRHLEPDWLVTRGGPVALRVAVGPIEVLTAGEALADAALGDLVEVRNLSSGAILRATVTARNMAELRPNMR
ncbi:flagellar basal body P-ring formation chaperone FlgA [Cereibacter azotoformans]|uniref:Flagella basal body P-ring formation protein FlgA n=1 Tax=Cereibacter sphaeroides (strain ATCC 17025 / ATH 2.4.3) TaxID=349102 RepID=A4WT00_CERS5|nr:flagellar basal body P-ring formation chaperone FlgA [Cereibacter azotoformans]ULB09816.1 flagellar basal body P-ring formation chaperone FlgA [Cereibacter azotoformans]